LNFEDERYVRVYTRKTVTTKLLGWEGRACLHALLLEVDRAGVLDLEGMGPAEALTALSDLPIEVTRVGMPRVLERGVAVVENGRLHLPRFMEAQEARQSDAQRQRESRARRAAELRSSEGAARAVGAVTNRDHKESHDVTACHEQSHDVTSGHSVLSSAQLSSADEPTVRVAPARRKRLREPDPPKPMGLDWQPPESVVEAQATRWQATKEQLLRTLPEFRDWWVRDGRSKSQRGWITAWTNRLAMLANRGELWVDNLRQRPNGSAGRPPVLGEHQSTYAPPMSQAEARALLNRSRKAAE
jgi:hypothetical protein